MNKDWLNSLLNTGLGAYTASTNAGAIKAQANAQAAAAQSGATTQGRNMTLWVLIGGGVLLVIGLLFAFRK